MKRKGTYVLFINLPEGFAADVGSLGPVRLPPGHYCYVGSAMGGLDQRVGRHLSHKKTIRWHIDNLTTIAVDMWAMEYEGTDVSECELGRILESVGALPMVDGFGCSDCHCHTHLYSVEPDIAMKELASHGLTKFVDKNLI